MLLPLGFLPILAGTLLAYALRPAETVIGAGRLAAIRAAVILGAGSVLLVEVLSAFHALTTPVLAAVWCVIVAGAAAAAYRRRGKLKFPRPEGRVEWVLVGTLGALLLAELLLAVLSPPNNYDSQTYHLPKIEHWVVQRDVDFFATRIHRQVSIAPGAEYLLLHLRLLTGGDGFYNLVQWGAGLGCVLAAARIAAQLGGDRRAQLISALVVGTAPIVALEASSTQTDLVVAFWVAAVATFVLDKGSAAWVGAATGLTALTKATGLLGAAPLLLVWLVRRRRRALLDAALVAVLAVAIAGPYLHRVDQTYGNPLGPPYLRDSISMQRHDPAAVLVNALHVGHTALNTPIGPVNRATARAIDGLSRALGVRPDDPAIVFPDSTFPTVAWPPDEDRASFPVQGALVLIGAVALLWRRPTRIYAGAFLVSVVLYTAAVKWQPWGNRLVVFLLVLGAPLAGLWLGSLIRRRVAAWLTVVVLAVGASAGWLAVGYGWPRRLVGHDSVFTESRVEARFNRRPQWLGDYLWAADALRAAGVRRVGLVQGEDTWEYPWWVLLRGVDIEALQTLVPGRQPARAADMDAVLCVTDQGTCGYYLPPGWKLHMHGIVGYSLTPSKS
jgi:hypothetical protein